MNPSLPFDLQRRLDDELDSGERLLWAGQPNSRRLAGQTAGLVFFGIPWTAFAIFWTVTAYRATSHASATSHAPAPFGLFTLLFPLLGLPFIAIGLSLLTSPFWAARSAQRTVYAVTDKRGLILEARFGGNLSVRSLAPPLLADRARNQRADGSGDLVFSQTGQVNRQNTSNGSRRNTSVAGFFAIPDVKAVDDLIGDTFEKSA